MNTFFSLNAHRRIKRIFEFRILSVLCSLLVMLSCAWLFFGFVAGTPRLTLLNICCVALIARAGYRFFKAGK